MTQAYLGFANIQELADDTRRLMMDAITVPNEWLPPRYQKKKQYVRRGKFVEVTENRSLSEIDAIYRKHVAKRVERASHKRERGRRIELYAKQFADGGKIEYEEFVPGVKPRKGKKTIL